MGQNRKKRKGKSNVKLDSFTQEIIEDKKEERRIAKSQVYTLIFLFFFAIAREIISPSDVTWIHAIKRILLEFTGLFL